MVRLCLQALLAVVLCPFIALAGQTSDSETEKEMSLGKQFFGYHKYDDATKHFKKANKLQNESCSECLIWLLRSQMGMGNLKEALKQGDRALEAAKTPRERSNAHFFRGMVLNRMAQSQGEKLAEAEAAFRASAQANPQCSDCRLNLGVILLKESKDVEGVELLKAVLPEYQDETQRRQIKRFIDDPTKARKLMAPEFSAKSRTGEEISLDTLRGKVVLLDFWGTWCPPCRDSVPLLKEIAGKFDPSKVAIVSIDEGDRVEKWAQFVEKHGMTWVQVYDEDHSMVEVFAVHTFPHYFLLSKDGVILQRFSGWSHGELGTLTRAIEEALKE